MKHLFLIFLLVFVAIVPNDCSLQFTNQSECVSLNHTYKPKFTIEQITSTYYPSLVSNDVNLDPCKSGKTPHGLPHVLKNSSHFTLRPKMN